MAKIVKKKIGQIWRLNHYSQSSGSYLGYGTYVIEDLRLGSSEDGWYMRGVPVAVLRECYKDTTHVVNRKSITTSKGKWEFCGEYDGEMKPYVISCRNCRSKSVKEFKFPPSKSTVSTCSLCKMD